MTKSSIEFAVQEGNITLVDADVLALKYAQDFHGTDWVVASLLEEVGVSVETLRPSVGEYRYEATKGCIQARHALFVGVPDLLYLNYQDIQKFATQVLNILAGVAPTTKHLAMTIHGPGAGLDEIEAFIAQIAGYLNALRSEQFPPDLEKITILDRNVERVKRLRQAFEVNFSHFIYISPIDGRKSYRLPKHPYASTRGNQIPIDVNKEVEEIASDAKPHVFVAMPFKKDMDDIFYYGIQRPVRDAGFICERVDQDAFFGNILDQVKKKIEAAVVVIAELTGANPNVYLEVGYAWGREKPTLLLVKDEQELRFDVRDQRCLKYERIIDLEEALTRELKELRSKKFI